MDVLNHLPRSFHDSDQKDRVGLICKNRCCVVAFDHQADLVEVAADGVVACACDMLAYIVSRLQSLILHD